jgi:hypothetical protein
MNFFCLFLAQFDTIFFFEMQFDMIFRLDLFFLQNCLGAGVEAQQNQRNQAQSVKGKSPNIVSASRSSPLLLLAESPTFVAAAPLRR